MVLALGVVLPFPAPVGRSHRGKQKAARDMKTPHRIHTDTNPKTALEYNKESRYNGVGAVIHCCVGGIGSRIGARGVGSTLRPAFYLPRYPYSTSFEQKVQAVFENPYMNIFQIISPCYNAIYVIARAYNLSNLFVGGKHFNFADVCDGVMEFCHLTDTIFYARSHLTKIVQASEDFQLMGIYQRLLYIFHTLYQNYI